jgi:hypothetical protein
MTATGGSGVFTAGNVSVVTAGGVSLVLASGVEGELGEEVEGELGEEVGTVWQPASNVRLSSRLENRRMFATGGKRN